MDQRPAPASFLLPWERQLHKIPQEQPEAPAHEEHLLPRIRVRNRAKVPKINFYFSIFSGHLTFKIDSKRNVRSLFETPIHLFTGQDTDEVSTTSKHI